MRMRKSLVYILLFLAVSWLNAYETYSGNSDLVRQLNAVYMQAGRAFPTASFPVDKKELHAYAVDLRRSSNNPRVRKKLDLYLEQLNYRPESREIVSKEKVSYEHYLRSDPVYIKDVDYYRSYVEMTPFFYWALSAGQDGGTGIHVSMELERQNDPDGYPSSNLFESAEKNPVAVENYFIDTGYLAHRSEGFLIQFGRSPMHFGAAEFSSFLPSDRLPFMDALYYSWEFGPLKMTSYISSLYNSAGGSEIADMREANLPNIEKNALDTGTIMYNPEPDSGDDYQFVAFDRTMILSAMHRFEWAFERLRLGITSMHLSSRVNNSFHIGDVFPVFSWHNGQVGVHNMSLVLEASLVPLPGLELFAQAGYDDINSEDISGVGDSSIPTIPAYLLGAVYSHDIGDRPAKYLLEGGYTHYLWGNFHEFDPNRGNYLSRAIYRYLRDEETVLLPLTSPYGPGSLWLRGDIAVQFSPLWRGSFRAETVFKNTRADLVTTAYVADKQVADAAMELWGYYAATLEFTKEIAAGCRLSMYTEPAVVVRDTQVWPEMSLGGSLHFVHKTYVNK